VCNVLDSDSTGGVRPSRRIKRAEPTRISFNNIIFCLILQIIVRQQLVRLHLRCTNLKFKSDAERIGVFLEIILSFRWKRARTRMISRCTVEGQDCCNVEGQDRYNVERQQRHYIILLVLFVVPRYMFVLIVWYVVPMYLYSKS
jgi:hypothetical protein